MNRQLRTLIFYIAVAMCVTQSCKKDKTDETSICADCAKVPEAKPENDNESTGVYKAVITGSSGTMAFYVQNGSSEVKAVINFDGKSTVLTSTYFDTWEAGTAISNAQFSGTLDGKAVTASLSVNADGTNPSLQLNIPGHNITVVIFKETSQLLVKAFEGTFSGDASGALNILMMGDEYTVITNGSVLVRSTQLKGGKVDFVSGGVTAQGEFINEDVLKGTWSNTDNEKGNWTAKRTL